jgi:hypothetical protein
MRSIKTAVKIFKKEIEMKWITYGIPEEDRTSFRRQRQEMIRAVRDRMIDDLLNRNRIGEIQIWKEDLEELYRMKSTPVLTVIERIYLKYI